jgi:hypothetical protein
MPNPIPAPVPLGPLEDAFSALVALQPIRDELAALEATAATKAALAAVEATAAAGRDALAAAIADLDESKATKVALDALASETADGLAALTATVATKAAQADHLALAARVTDVERDKADDADLSALAGVVATKAAQTDLTALAGRVTTAEGGITSLSGRVSSVETGKADVSAVTALTGRVSTLETGAVALSGRVAAVETGKAAAADLSLMGARLDAIWAFIQQGNPFVLPLRTSLVGSDGRVASFSRPSKAWYEAADGTIREVAEDQPRLRADLGVLIEEARTNHLLYSADLSNAAWVKTHCTIERVASPTAIGGYVNRITATAPGASVSQALAGLASAARIGSWRVRRVSGSGEVTIGSGAETAPLTLSNAFADVSLARADATEYTLSLNLAASGDVIDVEVAQVEDGSFRTSWIVTAGTALARAADVLSVSTAGWPLARGRIGIRYNGENGGGGGRTLFTTGSLSGVVGRVGSNALACYVNNTFVGGAVTLPTEYRLTCEWGDGSSRWFVDSAGPVGVRALVPSAIAPLAYVGSENGFSYFANGWLSDLEVSHV